jgi:hypothetical protein
MYQTRPAHVDQGVIAKQPVEPSLMQPAHVERAVGIEQPVVRLQGKTSEAKIAVQRPLGRIRL